MSWGLALAIRTPEKKRKNSCLKDRFERDWAHLRPKDASRESYMRWLLSVEGGHSEDDIEDGYRDACRVFGWLPEEPPEQEAPVARDDDASANLPTETVVLGGGQYALAAEAFVEWIRASRLTGKYLSRELSALYRRFCHEADVKRLAENKLRAELEQIPGVTKHVPSGNKLKKNRRPTQWIIRPAAEHGSSSISRAA